MTGVGRCRVSARKGMRKSAERKCTSGGEKEGQELTEYEAGMRSGYLQCQNDHGGAFKYGKARDAGFSKREAGTLSKKPWSELKEILAQKKKDKGEEE